MYTLGELADRVGGIVSGDSQITIAGAEILSRARPGQISFMRSDKFQREMERSAASAFIVPTDYVADQPCIQVDNPEHTFCEVVALFRKQPSSRFSGISSASHISPLARLGNDVTVFPGAFIDDDVVIGDHTIIHANVSILAGCEIGDHVNIFPNCVLYPGTQVGHRVNIHAGAVLGAFGFGYETRDGIHQLSAQLGNVVIGDDCDIGACSTIDRGTYGHTTIGSGTKIDNLVQIAHNCKVGRYNLIASQVGIAGSSSTGDYVIMAGQVGIGDHISVGSNAVLCAKSGVINDLPGDQIFAGSPVTPAKEQFHILAVQAKLPGLRQEVIRLRRQIEAISQSAAEANAIEKERLNTSGSVAKNLEERAA